MERLFNSYDIIRAVKAAQIRRNKGAKAERKRKQLATILGRHFKKVPSQFSHKNFMLRFNSFDMSGHDQINLLLEYLGKPTVTQDDVWIAARVHTDILYSRIYFGN